MGKSVVILAGGVGGARMARGFDALPDVSTTVVVNVGDDDTIHGLNVSPDLDTVVYTLAGLEGPEGWGRANETWAAHEELGRLGLDNSFRLGDRDLALNIFRTLRLRQGVPLSKVTAEIATAFGLTTSVLPVTDDPIRTRLLTDEWIDFQTYFVLRRHRDRVNDVRFDGLDQATPAPGVLEAISGSDLVVVAPSNPILSVRPIIETPGLRDALDAVKVRVGVSPLIGGKALKGPAGDILESLGYESNHHGVVASYEGLLTDLVIDESEEETQISGTRIHRADILIGDKESATRLAKEIISWMD